MTRGEIERAEEESVEAMREWLDSKKASKQRGKVDSRMLRTAEAADYLGISEWKLRQMVYSGEIEVIRQKYWLFAIDDLDKWITANREKEVL